LQTPYKSRGSKLKKDEKSENYSSRKQISRAQEKINKISLEVWEIVLIIGGAIVGAFFIIVLIVPSLRKRILPFERENKTTRKRRL